MRGAQIEPAWSPDGNAFAFVDRAGETPRATLKLQRSDEAQPRVIAGGDCLYSSPAWSPDGDAIAAVRVRPQSEELVLFDLQHDTERILTRLFPHRYGLEYRHIDWSPDGSMIAVDDKESENDPLSVYLVHLADGSRNRLTYPSMDIIGDVAPRFSPDGSSLAFIRIKYQGQNALDLVRVTGGEPTTVSDPQKPISDVEWVSPDRLLMAARLDDRYRFWYASVREQEGAPVLALPTGLDSQVQFAINRRSHRLAFSAFSPNLDIWAANVDAFTGWRPVITSPGHDVEPSFSPDGKHIAYRSDAGGREQIWVADLDARNAHPVNTGDLLPAVHAWDADEHSVLFKSRYRDGLYATSADGKSGPRQISKLAVSHPARSVDGRTIFARTGHFIYAVHRDNGRADMLTSRGGAPIIQSRDGRYLYFGQGRMQSSIARFDLQTRVQTVVLTSLMPGYNDCWALASRGIYHLMERDGRPVIAFFDFAMKRDRIITGFPGDPPAVGYSGFALSPDDRTLLVVRAEPEATNIYETSPVK